MYYVVRLPLYISCTYYEILMRSNNYFGFCIIKSGLIYLLNYKQNSTIANGIKEHFQYLKTENTTFSENTYEYISFYETDDSKNDTSATINENNMKYVKYHYNKKIRIFCIALKYLIVIILSYSNKNTM